MSDHHATMARRLLDFEAAGGFTIPAATRADLEAMACDHCDTSRGVTDWRSSYDPTPGPLPLCGDCAETVWQQQQDRAAEDAP